MILAWRRDEIDRLNTTCQQVMTRNGRLGPDALPVGDRQIHVGDRVVLGRNDLRGALGSPTAPGAPSPPSTPTGGR